jgi:hypothetical protein
LSLKALVILTTFSLVAPNFIPAQDTFCPQVANYFMDVTLDTERNSITGKEWVTWTNTSESPATELWFHLYWNAFQNNRSTFLQERARRGGGVTGFGPEDWGYCRVNSIRIIESQDFEAYDLTSRFRFRQPDDGNPFDQTVFSVRLPQPVAPGQSLDLVISFASQVPKPISRTGVTRDYYFIAQWFPKLGVFQDGVWNCHQFHSSSEFFADYGTYNVKITLPSTFIIGATSHSPPLSLSEPPANTARNRRMETARPPITSTSTASTISPGSPRPTCCVSRKNTHLLRGNRPGSPCCCSPTTAA